VINVKTKPTLLPLESIKGFNEIFGGLPLGELFGVLGHSQTNKSITTAQMIVDAMEQLRILGIETNAVIEDSEGGAGLHLLPLWLERWNKRFGTDIALEYMRINLRQWQKEVKAGLTKGTGKNKRVKDLPFEYVTKAPEGKQKLIVIDTEDLVRLMFLLGKVVEVDYGKGAGKVQVYVQPESNHFEYVWDTPLAKIIEENNVGFLLLDSLTMPVEEEYTGGQQSHPGRKYANMMIIAQLRRLVREYGLYCIINNHEIEQDSVASYKKKKPLPVGGAGVHYNFKFFMDLDTIPISGDERNRVRRRLVPRRHPHFAPEYKTAMIELTDKGVIDV
jgi:RecA/RadA recombinase